MHLALLMAAHDVGRDFWLAGTAQQRLEIEVGPGNCRYLKAAALRDPSTLFVGIEIRPSSLAGAGTASALPANARLLHGDAAWIVANLLAPGSVDAFHVRFPDPWWKKRHFKRRFFQPEACRSLWTALVPGGAVHVVTDVAPLFVEIRSRMIDARFVVEPWNRGVEPEAASSYERKYLMQGRTFEQASFVKRV